MKSTIKITLPKKDIEKLPCGIKIPNYPEREICFIISDGLPEAAESKIETSISFTQSWLFVLLPEWDWIRRRLAKRILRKNGISLVKMYNPFGVYN